MSEEIDNLKKRLSYCELEYEQNGYLSVGKFNAIKEAVRLIDKLQKENEELEFKLLARERGEAEFEVLVDTLQEENQELEKTIDLIIDDFQAENYFVGMTNKEVREYYKKRKELKE